MSTLSSRFTNVEEVVDIDNDNISSRFTNVDEEIKPENKGSISSRFSDVEKERTGEKITDGRSISEQTKVETQPRKKEETSIVDPQIKTSSPHNIVKGIAKGANDVFKGVPEFAGQFAAGATAFIPAYLAQFGSIGGAKIQQTLSEVSKDTLLEYPMKLVEDAQNKLGITVPKTPEEQAEMGEKVANYIHTYGGLLPEAKTKTAQKGLEVLGKGFEAARKIIHYGIDPIIDPEKFPNANAFFTSTTEIGVLGGIHAVGKVGIGKVKTSLGNKVKRGIKKEQEILDTNVNDIENYLKTKEGLALQEKVKEKVKDEVAKDPGLQERTRVEKIQTEEAKDGVVKQRELQANLNKRFTDIKAPKEALTYSEKALTSKVKPLTALEKGEVLGILNRKQSKELKIERDKANGLGPPSKKIIRLNKLRKNLKQLKKLDKFPNSDNKIPENYIKAKEQEINTIEFDLMPIEIQEVLSRSKVSNGKDYRGIKNIPDEALGWNKVFDKKIKYIEENKNRLTFLLKPLKNNKGAIELTFKKKQVNALENLNKEAKKQGKDLRTYLLDGGVTGNKVDQYVSMYEKMKAPLSSILPPKERVITEPSKKDKNNAGNTSLDYAENDFRFFDLKEGEMQSNITTDANGRTNAKEMIKVGNTDAIKFMDLEVIEPGLLAQWFSNPGTFGEKFKPIRPLLDQAREITSRIKDEERVVVNYLKEQSKKFSNKKLREEAGVTWHSLNPFGAEAMKIMKKKPKMDTKYFKELKAELQPRFKELLDRVNEARVKIGKKKIPAMDDYLSFFSKESIISDIRQLFQGGRREGRVNLVMDDLATISQRHAQLVKDSTTFAHMQRLGLRKGVKLELDPLIIYKRYASESLKHIHMSPLNAFVKQATTQRLTIPGRTTTTLREHNPYVARELESWSNSLAGKPNFEMPRSVDKMIRKLTTNMTAAVLGGNVRTAAIQASALAPSYTVFGEVGMMKAIKDYGLDTKCPIKKSSELNTRSMEAGLEDFSGAIAGTKYEKASANTRRAGLYASQKIDMAAAKITWRASWNTMKADVKAGRMTEREAIRRADADVVKLQASGNIVNLSPAQRSALGKALTLWQTYTISHANFVAKDLIGIGNKNVQLRNNKAKLLRYGIAVAAVNTLAEDIIGIQSPFPAPVKALFRGIDQGDKSSIALFKDVLLEISEGVPLTGSLKFGSHPLGPLMQYYGDIAKAIAGNDYIKQDLLPDAFAGDEKAIIAIASLVGKGLGITGTSQITKYVRGTRHRGESTPRALIGHLPENNSGGSSNVGRGESRSRRERKSSRRRPLSR